ncbi:uncharacterized protein LOC143228946 [Tachypleus tridentatus]|uniref:uncharacterized protein LOC143228946 n=1 Tax=Tachypleus tridentatus TaxID=6853 RepID=UPI003FD4A9AC
MVIPVEAYVILIVVAVLAFLVCVISCVIVSCYCKRRKTYKQKATLKDKSEPQRFLSPSLAEVQPEQKDVPNLPATTFVQTETVNYSPKPKKTHGPDSHKKRHNGHDPRDSMPEIYNRHVFSGGFDIRGGHFNSEDCVSYDSGYVGAINGVGDKIRGKKAPKNTSLLEGSPYLHACHRENSHDRLKTVKENLPEEEEQMVEVNITDEESSGSSGDEKRMMQAFQDIIEEDDELNKKMQTWRRNESQDRL